MIKTNAKQRYATDAITSFVVRRLVEKKGGKVQEFEVRNDMCVVLLCFIMWTKTEALLHGFRACGSTVGPGLSKVRI